jgi:hypothetical protein
MKLHFSTREVQTKHKARSNFEIQVNLGENQFGSAQELWGWEEKFVLCLNKFYIY